MTLHIIKLCVGADSLEDLLDWQKKRLADRKRKGQKAELVHITRQMPKRAGEVLDGGSLYWVIKGMIAARHRILELRSLTRQGVPHCGIVYDPKLVPVARRAHRPFQGWRYLDPKDAPPDARDLKGGNIPPALKAELAELGLL